MTKYETLSIIIGFLTIIVNFLMWFATYQTLKEVTRQNKNISNSIKSETIDKINSSHRQIFMTILGSDELTALFDPMHNTTDIGTRKNIVGTLFFNHIQTIYGYYLKGFLDDDDWFGYQNDIRSMFSNLDFLSERWNQVKKYYNKEFQDFLSTLIDNGRYYKK